VVDRVKMFLSFSFITVQNLATVSHTVWAYVGGSMFLDGTEALLPLFIVIAARNTTYRAEFGRSMSEHMVVRRGGS